jgi:hypothetical protein
VLLVARSARIALLQSRRSDHARRRCRITALPRSDHAGELSRMIAFGSRDLDAAALIDEPPSAGAEGGSNSLRKWDIFQMPDDGDSGSSNEAFVELPGCLCTLRCRARRATSALVVPVEFVALVAAVPCQTARAGGPDECRAHPAQRCLPSGCSGLCLDHLPGGRQHVPQAAVDVQALPGGFAGSGVGDEGVQGPAGVGDDLAACGVWITSEQ